MPWVLKRHDATSAGYRTHIDAVYSAAFLLYFANVIGRLRGTGVVNVALP